MKKILLLLTFSFSLSLALQSEWNGYIEENSANLNNGENTTIILKRNPNIQLNRGNNFGLGYKTNFTYSTQSGTSKLILQKDPSTPSSAQGTDMAYYIEGNILVNERSHLVMNLDSKKGQGLFRLEGGTITANASTIDINNVNTIVINAIKSGGIVVQNGGTLNINNVDILTNQSNANNAASIRNDNSTLYINANVYSYNKQSSLSTPGTNGGYFLQNGGQTTITGSFYNAGFYNPSPQDRGRQDSLVEINGGTFTVNGNFENGRNNTYAYSDYYGIGKLIATQGALITIGGNFLSDAQGDSFSTSTSYRSTVDLNDANLVVKGKFDAYRSDIFLTNSAKIYTTDFNLNSSASISFIGSDLGFGYVNASNQATFDGTVGFKLTGAVLKNENMSYLFLESENVSGIQEGDVTVYSSTGAPLSGYTSKIVKIGDKYFLVFGEANNVGNENYPQADATPPGGHVPGYGQEGGGSGGGETGGDSGSGGGNQGGGGNSGSDDNQGNDKPINPNTPPSSDPIYNAIYEALNGSLIENDDVISAATDTVKKQLDSMKVEQKTYQGSVMHHNMLGRIAHSHRAKYALNTRQRYATLASDFTRMPYFQKQEDSDNFYVNALAGYSHYKNSNSLDYGVNLGYDKEIQDSFFAGFYASISKRHQKGDSMSLDGYNYSAGLYSRTHLPHSLEFDLLGYYSNSQNEYERSFAGMTGTNKAKYEAHNIGTQARLGYRAEFINGHSLKPYFGFFATYYYMPAYKEDGLVLPVSKELNTFTSLYGALGLEYRKQNDDGGSFFVALEAVRGGAVFGKKAYELSMGDQKIRYENEAEFFGNLFAGANLALSKNLDLSATLMTQAYDNGFFSVNGSLGLRLVF